MSFLFPANPKDGDIIVQPQPGGGFVPTNPGTGLPGNPGGGTQPTPDTPGGGPGIIQPVTPGTPFTPVPGGGGTPDIPGGGVGTPGGPGTPGGGGSTPGGPGGVVTTPGFPDDGGTGGIPGGGTGGPGDGGQGGGEEIPGGIDYVIQLPGVFTTPKPDLENVSQLYPSSGSGSYPVILYLCEVRVIESGIRYKSTDELIIEPDIGAKGAFTVDKQGRITSVKITESGEGFTEYPRIIIRSETGYNAVLRPKLCIDRIGEDKFKSPGIQDQIVTVIDCVGKF